MKLIFPLILILLSLALTGTMAGLSSNDNAADTDCHASDTEFSQSSGIIVEPGFGLAPKSSAVSADDVLASVKLEDLRPDWETVYLLQASSEGEQRVVGFFTPLKGSREAPVILDVHNVTGDSGQTQLRFVKLDNPNELDFGRRPVRAAPCGG